MVEYQSGWRKEQLARNWKAKRREMNHQFYANNVSSYCAQGCHRNTGGTSLWTC